MDKYIALLRGINVGGNNKLPMKELKAVLEQNGFNNVQTYIQSGNVVFTSIKKPTADKMKGLIHSEFGFTPEVLIITEREFNKAVVNNPYSNHEGKLVHFYFCKKTPKINTEKMQKYHLESEAYKLTGKVFYLHAPDGIGRSKLVANIEYCLGVSATGRNLNTVNKLTEML